MSRSFVLPTVLVCLLAAGTGLAHHSIAVHFDDKERVTVIGTLTTLDWRNPHIELAVEATDAQGHQQTWRAESFPPNWFVRHRISKADFEHAIGQTVTIVVAPARDGSAYGTIVRVTFADGKEIVVRSGRP